MEEYHDGELWLAGDCQIPVRFRVRTDGSLDDGIIAKADYDRAALYGFDPLGLGVVTQFYRQGYNAKVRAAPPSPTSDPTEKDGTINDVIVFGPLNNARTVRGRAVPAGPPQPLVYADDFETSPAGEAGIAEELREIADELDSGVDQNNAAHIIRFRNRRRARQLRALADRLDGTGA